MSIIIFDFDDTIFNTRKLKKTIFDKIESLGISSEIVKNSYEISKKRFNHYTPDNHISIINEMSDHDISPKQTAEIKAIDFSLHRNDKIHDILSSLSKKNHLIHLTIGDQNFQKLKIHKSGISKYFHEIHIVSDRKEDFISGRKFTDDVYFINDKKSENKIIKKMFPNIKVIDFNINKREP